MKKWVITFLVIYSAIGVFIFTRGNETEKPAVAAGEGTKGEETIHMKWFVADPDRSTYKPPHWMTNKKLEAFVDDKSHHMETVEPTVADDRLMTFFAEAQLGDARFISSYVNPTISYQDYSSVDPDEVEIEAQQYADLITKKKSITEVMLSRPKEETPDKMVFDVTITYLNDGQIKLSDIPMVKMTEDINWYLDITLTQLADRVERAQKKAKN